MLFNPFSMFSLSLVLITVDGNISCSSISNEDHDDISADGTECETDYEVDSNPVPADLFPIPGQNVSPGQPLLFDVNISKDACPPPSSLPLCLMLNCRSICKKFDHVREILHTLRPSIVMASETWESEKQ